MRLFLCEKPSQARDIARVLGGDQASKGSSFIETPKGVVTWCFGHLLEQAPPDAYLPDDIPKSPKGNKVWRMADLPIIPKAWRIEVKRDARSQYNAIRDLLKKASDVVIATDADREGEMIAREVMEMAGYKGPIQRLWLSALDDASVKKALGALRPGASTAPLYEAALARSRADWLVGMNMTRAFSLRGSAQGARGVLSVGRVQTPTLALVVERDRDIENFKPSPYYDVVAHVAVASGRFAASWRVPEAVADEEGRCIREDAAHAVKNRVEGAQGVIAKAETQRRKESPPTAYDLSTLQAECSAKFGMGAKKVLDVAQSLYETHKITTYPRTDCGFLPESQFGDASSILAALVKGDGSLAGLVGQADPHRKSPTWNDAKITAHHGIIPTVVVPKLASLDQDERRVYDLIRRRYLAQFFPDYEYDQTSIEAHFDADVFVASGRVSRIEGWKVVYGKDVDASDGEDERDDPGEGGDQKLPPMARGNVARADRVDVRNKMTNPPRRYTEGTLLQAMKNIGRSVTDPKLKAVLRETSGIGTEATRANVIQTLLDREFLIKQKKNLISTDKARNLIDVLPDHVRSPVMTALWEQALEEIAEGKRDMPAFVADQATFMSKVIEMVREEIGNDAGSARSSDRPHADCPSCGAKQGAVRLHSSKTGRDFWKCESCSTFFEDNDGQLDVEAFEAKQTQLDQAHTCPVCHRGKLVLRQGKRGPFWACNAYPQCRALTDDVDGEPDMENVREPSEKSPSDSVSSKKSGSEFQRSARSFHNRARR